MPSLREVWWNAVKAKCLADRDAFMRGAKDWALSPIYVGKDLAAILLNKGREVHLVKLGNHPFSRARLHAGLAPLIYTYGSVMTRVEIGDLASQAFVHRLGFIFIGADGFDKFYTLEKLRHV